jgi:hypothetical protein
MALLDFIKKQANNATKSVGSFVNRAQNEFSQHIANPIQNNYANRKQNTQIMMKNDPQFGARMNIAKTVIPPVANFTHQVVVQPFNRAAIQAVDINNRFNPQMAGIVKPQPSGPRDLFTPKTPNQKIWLGDRPVVNLEKRFDYNTSKIEGAGVPKPLAIPLGFAATSLAFTGDLTPFPDSGSDATRSIIRAIDAKSALKVAKKFGLPTDTQSLNKIISSVDTKSAQSLLNNVKKNVPVKGGVDKTPFKFNQSAKESKLVSPQAKIRLTGGDKIRRNIELENTVATKLSKMDDLKAHEFAIKTKSDEGTTAAIQLAQKYRKQGNFDLEASLINEKAKRLREAGREVQAARLVDQMSPEGVVSSAAQTIQRYNETAKKPIAELTGSMAESFTQKAQAIEGMVEGREKQVALWNLKQDLADLVPSSIADKAVTVWKAGLLTSLRTHERNLIGNTIMQGSEIAKDIPATLVDKALSLRTGQRTLTPTLKGMKEFGSKKTRQIVSDMARYGVDLAGDLNKFDIKRVTWADTPVQQGLKKYTDIVFRTLGAEDKTFYSSAYARSLYDQAGAIAINNGKKGDVKFIKSLVKKPTDEMVTTATTNAEYAVFRDKNKLSGLASTLKNYTSKKWYTQIPAEVVAPFTGVPSSIVGKTIAYSPIGLVNGLKNATKVVAGAEVPGLQRLASQEIGRGVIGTGLFGIGAFLMNQGLMTGQPKDAKESDLWVAQGKQANSVMVDGKWRSINSIGPQTLVLLAGAKAEEMMGKEGGSLGEYAASLGKDQLSQTFLAGVQGPLNAITDPNRYGKSYVGNQVASVIPNIIKDTSKAFDKLQRENNNITDYVQNSIPGWRNQNTPKRDVLGNELKQEPTGAMAFVDLFNSKTPIDNPVVNELVRLNLVGSNATPSKTLATQSVNGQKVKLTPEQLDKLEAASGGTMRANLDSLVKSTGYTQLSDEAKAKQIDKVVQDAKLQAKISLLGQTPKEPAKKKVSLTKKKSTKKSSGKSGGSKKASFKPSYAGPSISQALGDAGKKVTLKYKGITGGNDGIGKAPATAKPKKRTGNL